jgi:uncharacterized membrane protein
MRILLIGLIGLGIAIGIYQARTAATLRKTIVTAVGLLALANFGASWEFFSSDPKSWFHTFADVFVYSGFFSFVLVVLPYLLAFSVTQGLWQQKNMK